MSFYKDPYRRKRANRPLSFHQADLALDPYDQRPGTPPALSTQSKIGVTLCTRSQSASSSVYSSSNEFPDGAYLLHHHQPLHHHQYQQQQQQQHLERQQQQQVMQKSTKFPAPNFIASKARPSTSHHPASINSVGLSPFTNNNWPSTSQATLANGINHPVKGNMSVKLPTSSELHRYSDDELLQTPSSRGLSSSPSNVSASNVYGSPQHSGLSREILQNRDLESFLSPRLAAADRSPGLYSVASSSKATTINLKARFVSEAEKMEEAKIQRKMLDLEITNKSLVEVNTMLEAQLQEERARVDLLEKKLRRLSGEYHHSNHSKEDASSDNQTTLYPMSPTAEESTDCPELDPVFFRVCGLVNNMIHQAESAIQKRPHDSDSIEADYRAYDWQFGAAATPMTAMSGGVQSKNGPCSPTLSEGRYSSALLQEIQGGFHGKLGHVEYGRIKELLKDILVSINHSNHYSAVAMGDITAASTNHHHSHSHSHSHTIGHFTVPNSRSTTPTPAPIERSAKQYKHPYRQKSRSLADVSGLVEELHQLLLKKDTIQEESNVVGEEINSSPKQHHRLKLHHPAGVIMDTGASIRMSTGHLQRPPPSTILEKSCDPAAKYPQANMLSAALSAAKTNMGGHVSNHVINRR